MRNIVWIAECIAQNQKDRITKVRKSGFLKTFANLLVCCYYVMRMIYVTMMNYQACFLSIFIDSYRVSNVGIQCRFERRITLALYRET